MVKLVGKKKSNWDRIFDRSYAKCSKQQPGQKVKLFVLEEQVLLGAIRRCEERYQRYLKRVRESRKF